MLSCRGANIRLIYEFEELVLECLFYSTLYSECTIFLKEIILRKKFYI